ncbi:MAG: hypothetical protein AAGC55_18655, partial [Myxococcota bacterium]
MTANTTAQRWMWAALPGAIALLGMVPGCALEQPSAEIATATAAIGNDDDDDCETDGCGLNSPIMDGLSMAEMHRSNFKYNQAGLRQAQFILPPGAPAG